MEGGLAFTFRIRRFSNKQEDLFLFLAAREAGMCCHFQESRSLRLSMISAAVHMLREQLEITQCQAQEQRGGVREGLFTSRTDEATGDSSSTLGHEIAQLPFLLFQGQHTHLLSS